MRGRPFSFPPKKLKEPVGRLVFRLDCHRQSSNEHLNSYLQSCFLFNVVFSKTYTIVIFHVILLKNTPFEKKLSSRVVNIIMPSKLLFKTLEAFFFLKKKKKIL